MQEIGGGGAGMFRRCGIIAGRRGIAFGTFLALCPLGGCYHGEALVERSRSAALNRGVVEVDLGRYRTTLPRDPESNALTDLTVHVFGTAPRYRAPAIRRQLESDQYRLRHRMLAALRHATREELAEPDLARLRTRIEQSVNEVLSDSPVTSIGFFDIRLQYE